MKGFENAKVCFTAEIGLLIWQIFVYMFCLISE